MSPKEKELKVLSAYGQAAAFRMLDLSYDPDNRAEAHELFSELEAAKATGMMIEIGLKKAILLLEDLP